MKIRSVAGGLVAAALLFTGPALAQVEAQEVDERLNFEQERMPVGLDVQIGVGELTGDISEDIGAGPLLGITAEAQPLPMVGVELGYEGMRLPIEEDLVGDGEGIYRHNLGLLAKAGPVLQENWRPFVGAGFGVTYVNPSDGAENLFDNDFISEVPLAVGLDYDLGNITAGARATYRLMYGEEFADDTVIGDANGNLWNAAITLGGRF